MLGKQHVLSMATARARQILRSTQGRIRHQLVNDTSLFLRECQFSHGGARPTFEMSFKSLRNTSGFSASVRKGQFRHAYINTWFVLSAYCM